MSYKNARDILPEELLSKIQKHVDGVCLYIPRKEEAKRNWGTCTATKKELETRNQSIYDDYQSGVPTSELAEKYYLSVKSIQRIIHERKIGSLSSQKEY